MGNILNDIVEEVNIKPNKTKLVLKWVISIAGSLIVIAFAFGQFKSSFFNRLDKLEDNVNETKAIVIELKTEMNTGFNAVDNKIDKVYDDGLTAFNDFQEYNNKQLGLIIDYGSSSKDLLKRMLEVNSIERSKTVENQLETAKNETAKVETPKQIGVKQYIPETEIKNYISFRYVVDKISRDTMFYLVGAKINIINQIDRNRYQLGDISQNVDYPNLFDVNYRNK